MTVALSRDKNNCRPWLCLDPLHHCEPIQGGHLDIEEEQVRRFLLDGIECLVTVRALTEQFDFGVSCQQFMQVPAFRRFVVDYKRTGFDYARCTSDLIVPSNGWAAFVWTHATTRLRFLPILIASQSQMRCVICHECGMRRFLLASLIAALPVIPAHAKAATLSVDPQKSKITVEVTTTVHDYTGTVTAFQVNIDCDANEPQPGKADLSFDFKDLKTGSKGRDKDILKWLKYASNPKGSFHLTSWKQDGTNSIALGELTVNGVQQSIQLPTAIKREGDEMAITAQPKWIIATSSCLHLQSALVQC